MTDVENLSDESLWELYACFRSEGGICREAGGFCLVSLGTPASKDNFGLVKRTLNILRF